MLTLLMFFLASKYFSFGQGDESHGIHIVDDVLNKKDVNVFLSRFTEEDILWNFHDVSKRLNNNDVTRIKGSLPASHPWMARLVTDEFLEGSFKTIWSKLKQHVVAKIGVKDVHIHQAGAQISCRGDAVLPSCYCANDSKGLNFLLVLFVLQNWDKNAYGEMVIYDKDREILQSIHPKDGRVVILPCKYNFVVKPPSMNCPDRLRTVTLHISPTKPSQELLFTRQDFEKYMNEMMNLHFFQSLRSIPFNYPTLDMSKYLTRQFFTSRGHPILVFDDLFEPEIINIIADTMLNGTYIDLPPSPDSTDNVAWIIAFEVDAVTESPIWHYAQAVVQYASKKEGYYPYDVSCNSIRSHDTTKIHLDCGKEQDEYTMLIYLNRNWTENDHGETVFFDYDQKEMIFAIRPKFGRVAIFQGTIPHSARPPSPRLRNPRFTLAIKFAASKEEALSKSFEQETDAILEYQKKAGIAEQELIKQHLREIQSGKISKEELEKIVSFYENKLKE